MVDLAIVYMHKRNSVKLYILFLFWFSIITENTKLFWSG